MFLTSDQREYYEGLSVYGKVSLAVSFIQDATEFLSKNSGIVTTGVGGRSALAVRELTKQYAIFMANGFPTRVAAQKARIAEGVDDSLDIQRGNLAKAEEKLIGLRSEYAAVESSESSLLTRGAGSVPHDEGYLLTRGILAEREDQLRADWRDKTKDRAYRRIIMARGGLMSAVYAAQASLEEKERERRTAVAIDQNRGEALTRIQDEINGVEEREANYRNRIAELGEIGLGAALDTRVGLQAAERTLKRAGITAALWELYVVRDDAAEILREHGNAVPDAGPEPVVAIVSASSAPEMQRAAEPEQEPEPEWSPIWNKPAFLKFRELTNIPPEWRARKVVLIWRGEERQELRVFADNPNAAMIGLFGDAIGWASLGSKRDRHNFKISREQYAAVGE